MGRGYAASMKRTVLLATGLMVLALAGTPLAGATAANSRALTASASATPLPSLNKKVVKKATKQAKPKVVKKPTKQAKPKVVKKATKQAKPKVVKKPTKQAKPKVVKKATKQAKPKPTPKPSMTAAPMVGDFTIVTPSKRVPMPAWTGPELLTGNQWSTGALAGHITVVNFWASWCPSCKEEWQALQDAAAARPEARFYAVNTMDSKAAAQGFVNGHPSSFPVIFDERAVLQMSFTTVPNRALPFTLVLDAKGRIAAWKSGPTDAATIERVLASSAI